MHWKQPVKAALKGALVPALTDCFQCGIEIVEEGEGSFSIPETLPCQARLCDQLQILRGHAVSP